MDSGDANSSAMGLLNVALIGGLGFATLNFMNDMAQGTLYKKPRKQNFDLWADYGVKPGKKGRKKADYFDDFWDL